MKNGLFLLPVFEGFIWLKAYKRRVKKNILTQLKLWKICFKLYFKYKSMHFSKKLTENMWKERNA